MAGHGDPAVFDIPMNIVQSTLLVEKRKGRLSPELTTINRNGKSIGTGDRVAGRR
jgi:hypothetical protein